MNKTLISIFGLGLGLLSGLALAQDKVTFASNWRAQPGHGGFYQALADGTYKKYGLDVTIQQGGPQVNNRPMLPAGRVDFLMAGNMLRFSSAMATESACACCNWLDRGRRRRPSTLSSR